MRIVAERMCKLSRDNETDPGIDGLDAIAINKVNQLLIESEANRSCKDIGNRKRFARLLREPAAIAVTMGLTDEVMRISNPVRAAKSFRTVSKDATISGLGLVDYLGIKIAVVGSIILPKLVMKAVRGRVEFASNGIILPAEKKELSSHISKRSQESARLNINVLGEAVLGNNEATERFNSVIEMIRRPEANYASVKISAIVSQLITIDHFGSVERVLKRLRVLYREAKVNKTFINLDMEEYRDLSITVEVFKTLLDEPEFADLNAGIVLQAYLPESHYYLENLIEWSRNRFMRSGATIKIRIVKGANLAMEKAEAELHGWTPAPYPKKSDVDASYTRLIDLALRPENAKAVRIGIASHNLFHIAWSIEVAKNRGVIEQLDIEMLEGMANAEALAIAKSMGSVLLYTPVTRKADFPSAVAYLVRRLDENTSLENYLRASFDMKEGSANYLDQKDRFKNSVSERHTIVTQSRRHSNMPISHAGEFANASDADLTNPIFQSALATEYTKISNGIADPIPVVINGAEILNQNLDLGLDPNEDGKPWYKYSVINSDDVDNAIQVAQSSLLSWESIGAAGRAKLLQAAATLMESGRAKTIAIMARDAGKTVSEADPEVSEAIDFARYYADSALKMSAGSTPLGVVLIVPPWNFPYAIPMGGVCAALAAGNTVILKPAPETVATAWEIVQQLWASGIPKNVLQFLPSRDDAVGKYLISHPGIAGLILTGALSTAELFLSWKPDLNLMAETSGKNSLLISASADIDSAVKDLVQSAFGHAGQKCSAASLGIVDSTILRNPAFLKQLKDAVVSLSVGSGVKYGTTVGPVIRAPEAALLRALTTLEAGETWLVEPTQIDSAGFIWSPGVKLGVKANSWSHKNEWFGPVLGIMEAPNFVTALKWQNDVDFGLTSGIHSLDTSECAEWITGIEAGNLYVNRGITGAIVNRQPFGGWKRSSVGATAKAGGPNYLSQLRNWVPLTNSTLLKESANQWWERAGKYAIDRAGLNVERNYQRYCKFNSEILVVIDNQVSNETLAAIDWVSERFDLSIRICKTDSISDLLSQIERGLLSIGKVRWLSNATPPIAELLALGISVDPRPITNEGSVEIPRWFREQSVAITNHRYGNVGAGPKPILPNQLNNR